MKFIKSILFCLLFIAFAGTAAGQSSAELKRKKSILTKEIERLNKSLRQTSGSKRLSLKQINELNAQISLREEKINTINSEIRLLDNQIEDNTQNVYSLQTQLNRLKKEYAAMVLFAFRNRSAYNKLMFIFASRDFNQAYKRLKYLSQFGDYRIRQAHQIEHTQQVLHVKINELDKDKKEKSNLLNDEQKEKTTLGQQKEKQAEVLSKLSKQEKQLQQQLGTKQKEAARLAQAIQKAINREIEAARRRELAARAAREKAAAAAAAAKKKANPAAPVSKPAAPQPVASGADVLASTPEAAKISSDFTSNRGRLPWPVSSGKIVEGFGKHSYGVNVTLDNNGVNIKTAPGAPVRAVFGGEVTAVQDIGGNYIVLIKHGQYFTVYSNLRSVSVSRGQKIGIKETVGTVLTNPADNTAQLHFEIRKGVVPMNPSSWLAGQ